ncbi:trans-aconitate 2-methyltransferase [Flavivirga sp. 57AJ16]|uniref:class I SAM-dependent methyltransferase n=1 Tax=Flavivirga sp. 57AJ16 TaxID=3025307 RepID=UPI002365F9A9|nr:class I SAM-dependent methyltransferase [Flavivirga sp. 57AJ16]MDD7887614.1 class I SAM-dependent methyltransferase [Flavivirga sp. 57AJ16]
MNTKDIHLIYDAQYGIEYNNRFHDYDEWIIRTDAHTKIIENLHANVVKDTPVRWLDVACGTGYLLSRFPDSERVGLDLSPGMIVQARKQNPTVTIIEGNYLNTNAFEKGSFDVISETGWGHTYVDSFEQWDVMVKNFHGWLNENGSCFITLATLNNVYRWAGKKAPKLPYFVGQDFGGGQIRISGFEWTWKEGGGYFHRMRVPNPKEFKELFDRYFDEVHLVQYPPDFLGIIGFKQKQDPAVIEQIIADMKKLNKETTEAKPESVDKSLSFRKFLSKVKYFVKYKVSQW